MPFLSVFIWLVLTKIFHNFCWDDKVEKPFLIEKKQFLKKLKQNVFYKLSQVKM